MTRRIGGFHPGRPAEKAGRNSKQEQCVDAPPGIPPAQTSFPDKFFSVFLCAMNQNAYRQLRSLLILGRVSNLPTVWSNCFAGWWLGGGENFAKLPLLFLGVMSLAALFAGRKYARGAIAPA